MAEGLDVLKKLIVSSPAVDNAKCLPYSCGFLDQCTRDCSNFDCL